MSSYYIALRQPKLRSSRNIWRSRSFNLSMKFSISSFNFSPSGFLKLYFLFLTSSFLCIKLGRERSNKPLGIINISKRLYWNIQRNIKTTLSNARNFTSNNESFINLPRSLRFKELNSRRIQRSSSRNENIRTIIFHTTKNKKDKYQVDGRENN